MPHVRSDHHVVDEHHPLAPVVEGGELSDDRQQRVGMAEVVAGRVRQVLDLADHVVAEVADEAGVERRQIGAGPASRSAPRIASRAASIPPSPLTRRPVSASRSSAPSADTSAPRADTVASGFRPTNE